MTMENPQKKILLVEPDRFYAEILQRLLEREGFQVIYASQGEQALRDVAEEQPDLILLAIKLSKKDGFEVLEEIKREKGAKAVHVVMLTELGSKEDIDHCLTHGADCYLIKTQHTPGEIIAHIKECLETGKQS